MGWAFVYFLSLLPFTIIIAVTWFREYQLHGRDLPRAVRVAARATWRSRTRVFLIVATGALAGALFAPRWLSLSTGERITAVAAAATTFAWVLRPPGILILASSDNSESRRLISKIGWRAALGHRVVFLLAPAALREAAAPDVPIRDRMDNLYATTVTDWMSNVHELLDIAPMIVIDARQLSEGLAYELAAVESSYWLSAKTYVVIDQTAQVFVAAELPILARKMVHERNIVDAVTASLASAHRQPA